jgi:Zn-dependent alcohol dehydrogenase
MIEAGVVNVDDMITHRIKLDQIEDALHMIQKSQENIRKILIEI